jgi:hypothetical protein
MPVSPGVLVCAGRGLAIVRRFINRLTFIVEQGEFGFAEKLEDEFYAGPGRLSVRFSTLMARASSSAERDLEELNFSLARESS